MTRRSSRRSSAAARRTAAGSGIPLIGPPVLAQVEAAPSDSDTVEVEEVVEETVVELVVVEPG